MRTENEIKKRLDAEAEAEKLRQELEAEKQKQAQEVISEVVEVEQETLDDVQDDLRGVDNIPEENIPEEVETHQEIECGLADEVKPQDEERRILCQI